MKRVVILSPHLDDAVFSCWHSLGRSNVTVLTVFAGLPPQNTKRLWDWLCGEIQSRQMAINRRTENDNALKGLKLSVRYLDYLDDQYRSSPPALDELVADILKSSPDGAAFLAPLAASGLYRHPDHVLLRQVGLELLKRGKQVAFYPDSPYMQYPVKATPQYIQKLSQLASEVLTSNVEVSVFPLSEADVSDKRQAMMQYQSQYQMTNVVSLGGLTRQSKRNFEIEITPSS